MSETTWNDRDDLGCNLDDAQDGRGIVSLINDRLEVVDFQNIWSACHGGNDPPMNLIFVLASSQNCTLAQFKKYAEDKRGRLNELISYIDNYRSCFEKRLDQLEFKILIGICEMIRARPHPTSDQAKPIWKRIASKAGLDDTRIANLDAPGTTQGEGLTMTFVRYVTRAYPLQKVAWLAEGLLNIGRHDILMDEDLEMFNACKRDKCIVIGKK